jgi:hypothetical protein
VIWTVPWLRLLVAGVSPHRPGFAPGSNHVGKLVNKLSLVQVSLRVLRCSPVYLIPPSLSKVSRHPRLGTSPPPSGRSRGSSVSTVSGYGQDDRAMEVRSQAGAENFYCSLCVQNDSGAHPASCPMCTGVVSPRVKHGPDVMVASLPLKRPSTST